MSKKILTEEDHVEWTNCALDPIYFINKYAYAVNVLKNNKVTSIECFDYQERVLNAFLDHRMNVVLKSRQCLPTGTMVNTPDGIKAIEDFQPGDKVWSYDLENSKKERDTVYDAWQSGERDCVTFKLRDTRNFTVGENHPFYVEGKGFVKAKDLEKGDEIKSQQLLGVSINSQDSIVESVEKSKPQMCYDISVDKNENFFVDGLLTHNTGLSVITACYVAWKMVFGIDEYVVIVANNQNAAKRFLKHVKQVLMFLPDFLYNKERDEETFSALEIKLRNGNYAIAQAAGKNAVRGDTPTLLILDEWAFVKDDEDIWTAAAFALSQSEGDCIAISTPHGTSGLYHKFWVEAENGTGAFNPLKVHWTENPKAAEGLEMREGPDGQLKPWSPWYEERCKEANYDQVRIAQELDLSFAGSKLLALDPAEIERQRQRINNEKIQPQMYFDFDAKMPFVGHETECHIFEMPKQGERYILACDVAYKGDDFSTIQLLNVKTMNQAVEYQGKVDLDIFAHMIANLASWYNQAFVVVEANNHGLVTCFELRNQIKYPNLYESKSSHPKDIHVRHIDYVVRLGDGIPGFMTTSKSRPSVVNSIREYMRETDLKINSKRLINEMDTFIRNPKRGGREEAEQGYHDDLVMAYGIALYILSTEYYNQNVARDRSKAMLEAMSFSDNKFEGKQRTPEEIARYKEQEKKMKDKDFVPPGAGGLWIGDNDGGSSEDDPDDISWLLG